MDTLFYTPLEKKVYQDIRQRTQDILVLYTLSKQSQ